MKNKVPATTNTRKALVAMVKFLATLGDVDFPVFEIITHGAVGHVTFVWGEKMLNRGSDVVSLSFLRFEATSSDAHA